MTEVIATQKGFFGQLREVGDKFDIPDELWADEKRRPRWCAPAAFGGKGDHDGDGKPGGAKPETAAKKKAREKAERAAAKAGPFADAPEPVRATNEIAEATGAIEPDWVAPKPID